MKKIIFSVLLLLLTLLSLYLHVQADDIVKMKQGESLAFKDEDKGFLTDCTKGNEQHPFYFEWKPRVFKPQKTFVLNISVPIMQSYTSGNACVTVFLKGIKEPIYLDCGIAECTKIKNYATKIFRDFTCPLPKDYVLKKYFPYKLDPSIPLPAGDYQIRVELQNTDSKPIFCLFGDVSIED